MTCFAESPQQSNSDPPKSLWRLLGTSFIFTFMGHFLLEVLVLYIKKEEKFAGNEPVMSSVWGFLRPDRRYKICAWSIIHGTVLNYLSMVPGKGQQMICPRLVCFQSLAHSEKDAKAIRDNIHCGIVSDRSSPKLDHSKL